MRAISFASLRQPLPVFASLLLFAGCASVPTTAPVPSEGLTKIVVEISGME